MTVYVVVNTNSFESAVFTDEETALKCKKFNDDFAKGFNKESYCVVVKTKLDQNADYFKKLKL